MRKFSNHPVSGKHGRPIVLDLAFQETGRPKPLVIFVHGYKGFKDWGVFGAMESEFLSAGFALLRVNFSHNGGTVEEPIDFPDLEAFGRNTYSIELDDVQSVLDWVHLQHDIRSEVDAERIGLIGHSRGGAMATLTASRDRRVRQLVTWAAVSSLNRSMFHDGPELDAWRKNGVLFVRNGRTQQDMPHYIQFYEEFQKNRSRLDVERAAQGLQIPHLIVHGTGDVSVPFDHAEALHAWNPASQLVAIPEADHVFGGKHPWASESLPAAFQSTLAATIAFFQSNNL